MASPAQIKALLAVPCRWCGAPPGQRCGARTRKGTLPITTLDGECHDMRWKDALRTPAPVLAAAVQSRGRTVAVPAPPAPECPW